MWIEWIFLCNVELYLCGFLLEVNVQYKKLDSQIFEFLRASVFFLLMDFSIELTIRQVTDG